jgi:hypothetical protein
MKRWLAAVVLGLAGVLPAAGEWRLSPREVRDEVKVVVAAQLEAFQREDFAAAYALAATGIRRQFRLPVYERMIRRGYAPLLGHDRADPGVVQDDGGAMATMPVIVRDREGRPARFRYHLLREDDGWRVSGVMPEKVERKGEM